VSGRNRAVGAAGEAAAVAWYEARGYQVLARNWRCREGELDLVLAQRGTIVFCEVKARTSAAFGLPAEAVTRTKQQRIRLLATRWLEATGTRPTTLRFDVACVLAGEITVLEACF
jgi:putative endonuclease